MGVNLTAVPQLGLALGGGGALGIAHIGVAQVMWDRGLKPTIVVGSSVGAVFGAALASGMNPYELEERLHGSRLDRDGIVDATKRDDLFELLGLRGDIAKLGLTLGVVVTRLRNMREHVLADGDLILALRASVALPLVYLPVSIAGTRYIDGGGAKQLPLGAALDLGADHVIGVRVAREWDFVPLVPRRHRVHRLERDSRVTMVRPDLRGFLPWRTYQGLPLIQLGREAAELALDTAR